MAALLPAAVLIVWTAGGRLGALSIVAATAAIAALGLVDDLRPLPARWRLGAQMAAALIVISANGDRVASAWSVVPVPAWAAPVVAVFWIVWVTNLYNFMDGIDGLAGGQAVIAAIAIAVVARGGVQGAMALAIAGAALGFLIFNLPPASIFMGDVGSTALGFLFASMPFMPEGHHVSVEVVALALGLFVLDATTTLVRRLACGEEVFKAHKTHLYQRPLACGITHRRIALTAYAGMLWAAAAAVAFGAVALPGQLVLLSSVVMVFLVLAWLVSRVEKRYGR